MYGLYIQSTYSKVQSRMETRDKQLGHDRPAPASTNQVRLLDT